MTELVPINNGISSPTSIEGIKQAIASIQTVEQAMEATDITKGLTAYAKAKQSLDLVNQAIELRIWAERKGGEAIVRNGDKLADLYRTHGIHSSEAQRWIFLYLIDERFIRDYITETEAAGRQLSIPNLLSRGRDAYRKRLSPGLYKEINGLFSIEWKENGRTHRQGGLKTRQKAETTLEYRKRMARRLAPVVARASGQNTLSKAYGHVRLALDLVRTVKDVPLANEVYDHLYRAEDTLTAAMKDGLRSAGQRADK